MTHIHGHPAKHDLRSTRAAMPKPARVTIVNVGYRLTNYWVVSAGTSHLLVTSATRAPWEPCARTSTAWACRSRSSDTSSRPTTISITPALPRSSSGRCSPAGARDAGQRDPAHEVVDQASGPVPGYHDARQYDDLICREPHGARPDRDRGRAPTHAGTLRR
jgi:hypothetical protein